jgi:nitrous oxidase accessory protein NosD
VNAAPSGSVIKVCPGGYPEQVVIDKPLTLEGFITAGTEGAFILPPAGGIVQNDNPYSAQVLVQNTTGVTITNLIRLSFA